MAGRDYSGRGVEPRLRVRNCTNYALYWDQRFREVVVAKIGILLSKIRPGVGGAAYLSSPSGVWVARAGCLSIELRV